MKAMRKGFRLLTRNEHRHPDEGGMRLTANDADAYEIPLSFHPINPVSDSDTLPSPQRSRNLAVLKVKRRICRIWRSSCTTLNQRVIRVIHWLIC